MWSGPPSRRGWRRLDVTFLVLFFVVLAGLATIAIVVDRVGFDQAREALIAEEKHDVLQFRQRLESEEGSVLLTNVEVRPGEGQLRPTKIPHAVRTMWGHDPVNSPFFSENPGGNACYLRFTGINNEHLDICSAWQRRPRTALIDDRGGGMLFVTVRFNASLVTPRLANNTSLTGIDTFHLEVASDGGDQRARWVLVFGPASTSARPEMLRDFKPDSPLAGWQITAYRVTDLAGWTVDAEQRLYPDFRIISGSLTSDGPADGPYFLAFKIQTGPVFEDAAQFLGGRGPIVRLAYVPAAGSGLNSVGSLSTFVEANGITGDKLGVPLVGIASRYSSPGFGEQITILGGGASHVLWTTTNNSGRVANHNQIPVWPRRLWLGDQIKALTFPETDGFPYIITVSLPTAPALARWNQVAARLAISYAAIASLMLLFYLLVRRAVLQRLMILARTAETITGSTDISLPYQEAGDEVGILSRTITALLGRLREEGARREQEERERIKREYDTLRQIGHHIRSPLQALLALNPEGSEGRQYVERMSRAVVALYGSDAPRESFRAMYGEAVRFDLVGFLSQLAANSQRIGVPNVLFQTDVSEASIFVDDGALVDVMTQILNNAQRLRVPETPIQIALTVADERATITIANEGPLIEESRLKDIFEYGVSLAPRSTRANQGQGLFVAAEFVAKMLGTINARNLKDGVAFDITIPLARVSVPNDKAAT